MAPRWACCRNTTSASPPPTAHHPIGETLTALNGARLEVLVIPPDLMDRLKKKGGIDKLRGQVRFSSLPYLTVHPVERRALTPTLSQGERAPAQEARIVRLKNHVLLSPEAINLDDANRAKSIYSRLGWSARNGGLERSLIHWAQVDAQVLAFCKISENRHTFARPQPLGEASLQQQLI